MRLVLALVGAVLLAAPSLAAERAPIPDKLVVLTFDDAVKSHYTVVRPILKKYGFGATFFITEGFDFPDNKQDYLTWDEIAQLHKDGFEIGNHTRDHLALNDENVAQAAEQVRAINERCAEHGIPKTTSFAWPGNSLSINALPILQEEGILFARRGGAPEYPYDEGRGFAYEPGLDHPLLIPSAGDARPNWRLEDFVRAAQQARQGRIAVIQFHGVPDRAHPWVHTAPEQFEAYMKYLAVEKYQVIALRDLARFVDPQIAPKNHEEVIDDRRRALAAGSSRDNFRTPPNDDELRYWLENMAVHHQFSTSEIGAATGLTPSEIAAALGRFNIDPAVRPAREPGAPLLVLPYPGGRHPRIGFRDGAIRPQRETKVSIFAPWKDGGYVVADTPEAIWTGQGTERELLYLAHTHVPTMWTRRGVELEPLEWTRQENGEFSVARRLPNAVEFGARVVPGADGVRMELWLTNGSEATLTGLRVQNCVMLKDAPGFADLTTENKVLADPYVACRNAAGNRWIITGWENCVRPWANSPCPCMHADPQFPDCAPGETQRLRGWLSFYEGTDIHAELKRLDAIGWRDADK